MGLFNDIDDWFMDSVHAMIVWLLREKTLCRELDLVVMAKKESQKVVEAFDKTTDDNRREVTYTCPSEQNKEE